MIHDPADNGPDQEALFESLVIAYDEALARGEALPLDQSLVPPQLQDRLRAALACVSLLARSQTPGATAPAVAMATARGAENMPLKPRIGRFDLLRELGRGGHGVVFLAVDPRLSRLVALKVPRPEVLVTPELHRRFLREGRAASALAHPNLVPIYEVGDDGPLCYIAAGYCDGPSLAQWLKQHPSPLPWHEAAALLAPVADAASHAHVRGIIHRDIKPANILLAPAEIGSSGAVPLLGQWVTPCLTDFGLARLIDDDASDRTRVGTMLGTPCYMAPEQAEGRTELIGLPTDVYALGAVLYELLVGHAPFRGANDLDTLRLVSAGELVHPSGLRPGLPRDLEAICLRCLNKSPSRRYACAAELAADLGRFLSGKATLARPWSRAKRLVGVVRKHPTATVAAVAALVFTASGWWRRAEPGPAPTTRQELERSEPRVNFADKPSKKQQYSPPEWTPDETSEALAMARAVSNHSPVLVANTPIAARRGEATAITTGDLRAADADNTAAQLVYAIATPPALGALLVDGAELSSGDTFTQQDIDDGKLAYRTSPANAPSTADGFSFTLSDGSPYAFGPNRVSVDSSGQQATLNHMSTCAMSASGDVIAFDTQATFAGIRGSGAHIQIYVRRGTNTSLVTCDAEGLPGNDDSQRPALSADGRYIVFQSLATNLVPGGAKSRQDIFRRDLNAGVTEVVSLNSDGQRIAGHSFVPAISADGRYVAFHTAEPLTGDNNHTDDAFVRDMLTGTTTLVSAVSGSTTEAGDANSGHPTLSASGRYVLFASVAGNLVPDGIPGGKTHLFVRDTRRNTTTRVSVNSAGLAPNEESVTPVISADGRYVAFESLASNLVDRDANRARDAFIHDLLTHQTIAVSTTPAGVTGNSDSFVGGFSGDGRCISLHSHASDIDSGPGNDGGPYRAVMVRSWQSPERTAQRVSVNAAGITADGHSLVFCQSLSADGRYVAFRSGSDRLVPGDTNTIDDIFLVDRGVLSRTVAITITP